jgi:hypothetical protein
MTNIDLSVLPQWLSSRKSGQLSHGIAAFRRLRNGAAWTEPRMTSNVSFYKRHSLLRSASLLLLLTVALSLSAQVIPQLESPPRISVFSTLAEVKPDYQILRRLRGLGSHLGSLFAKPTHPGDRGKVICDEMGRPGVRGISPCWSSLFNAFRPSFSVSLHSGRRSERLALEQPASYWVAGTSIRRGPWSSVVHAWWPRHLLRISFCDSDGGAFYIPRHT